MARKKITQYFDDIDGTMLEEHEVHIVRFSLDGRDYVIDLSEKNANDLRSALEKYVEAARPAPTLSSKKVNPTEVREWARAAGINVATRGKIPHDVIEQFRIANPNA